MNTAVRTLASCAALVAMIAIFVAAALEVLFCGKSVLSDLEE